MAEKKILNQTPNVYHTFVYARISSTRVVKMSSPTSVVTRTIDDPRTRVAFCGCADDGLNFPGSGEVFCVSQKKLHARTTHRYCGTCEWCACTQI